MATITVIEYGSTGSNANRDTTIADLHTALKTTVDATTSTTPESIVLNKGTNFVAVIASADHRISTESSNCSDKYDVIGTARTLLGVEKGATLYYRTA